MPFAPHAPVPVDPPRACEKKPVPRGPQTPVPVGRDDGIGLLPLKPVSRAAAAVARDEAGVASIGTTVTREVWCTTEAAVVVSPPETMTGKTET